MNDYPSNLFKDKPLFYGLIYSLELMKLETLKIYIKANLVSSFIQLSKFPFSILILFARKKNSSLCLWIDYWEFNNLTIKNCYLLLLISKLLNCLGCTKHFTQLDLTNIYHQMRIWKGDKWKTVFQIRYSYFEY